MMKHNTTIKQFLIKSGVSEEEAEVFAPKLTKFSMEFDNLMRKYIADQPFNPYILPIAIMNEIILMSFSMEQFSGEDVFKKMFSIFEDVIKHGNEHEEELRETYKSLTEGPVN